MSEHQPSSFWVTATTSGGHLDFEVVTAPWAIDWREQIRRIAVVTPLEATWTASPTNPRNR